MRLKHALNVRVAGEFDVLTGLTNINTIVAGMNPSVGNGARTGGGGGNVHVDVRNELVADESSIGGNSIIIDLAADEKILMS